MIFSEETPGTLGILSGYAINDRTAVQLYLAFEDKMRTQRPTVGVWDHILTASKCRKFGAPSISPSAGSKVFYRPQADDFHREYYLGGDFVGAVGDVGVYGEAVLNLPGMGMVASISPTPNPRFTEVLYGGDYILTTADLTLRMEYYHQGRGVTKKTDYDLMKGLSTGQVTSGGRLFACCFGKNFLNYYTFMFGVSSTAMTVALF